MPKQLTFYGVLLGILLLSVVVGNSVAEGDYFTPTMMLLAALGVAAIVVPGYGFFLALGLLCPFAFPIPYIYRFPFAALILGLCCVKFVISQSLSRDPFGFRLILNATVLMLFGWVVFRFCLNPVTPGLAVGTGNAITGFRGYLTYGISLGYVIMLPLFVRTRDDVLSVVRWIGYISLFLTVLFIPLTLSKSLSAAQTLTKFGMFVSFFDNGWLRFVSLSGYGQAMVVLALLPHAFPHRRLVRVLFFLVGLAAVIMGGNRSSLAMTALAFLGIAFVRRQRQLFLATVFGICLVLGALYVMGETLAFQRGVGFLRIAALVSPRAARLSEADQTYLWRKLRWDRTMVDIKTRPWIGWGYGGVNAVFAYATLSDFEENQVEIDVAAGSIHNGFLSGARVFGVPFCLFFICILLHQIMLNGRQTMREVRRDPVQSDLHCVVFASLLTMPLAIYIAADLNNLSIWFYVTLGLILFKLKSPRSETKSLPGRDIRRAPNARGAGFARHLGPSTALRQ
jgi:hypothetical protein